MSSPNTDRSPSVQPSLMPGVVLLGLAAVLIVIVVVDPNMVGWLKVTITVLAVLVVVALLGYAFRVFRISTGRRR